MRRGGMDRPKFLLRFFNTQKAALGILRDLGARRWKTAATLF
jgi:hypothetical protein